MQRLQDPTHWRQNLSELSADHASDHSPDWRNKEESDMPEHTASPAAVEIISDEARVKASEPLITVRTGQTGGKTFVVKINHPEGRATLIAVHL
jgi:hypothetical protein